MKQEYINNGVINIATILKYTNSLLIKDNILRIDIVSFDLISNDTTIEVITKDNKDFFLVIPQIEFIND